MGSKRKPLLLRNSTFFHHFFTRHVKLNRLRWFIFPVFSFILVWTASAFKELEIFQTLAEHEPVPVEEFVNFESAHVHPMDMTPDGSKLLAVNTAANTLEVFAIEGAGLTHLYSVAVGMDPVSVRARNNNEVWVANVISDNISIVDLNQEVVIRSLSGQHMNEPSDIVFAGNPKKAFVSSAERESIFIYDLSDLDLAPEEVLLVGEQPRAMAVSPDGNTVYTAFFESGNQTTVINGNGVTQGDFTEFINGGAGEGPVSFNEPVEDNITRIPIEVDHPNSPYGGSLPIPNAGNAFVPPLNPSLPAPLNQSLVVRKDNNSGQWLDDNGGDWTQIVSGGLGNRQAGWDLKDRDVAVLDANSLSLSYQKHLGNILMAMAVNPVSGEVSVVGTDALNHIRYEPNLNGTFLRVNISQFSPGNANSDITDLNDHLDYSTPSVSPALRQRSIGDPRGIAWTEDGNFAYITGMGSDNVIIVDQNGNRTATPPIQVGEGPTGIVLDQANDKVYVLNKFDATISILSYSQDQELSRVAFFDPTPNDIKVGRRHLYNTHIGSGNGTISCASCHVDGKWDRLAWDLGNPAGDMETLNGRNLTPLKGLKVTQQLIDIIGKGDGLLHWRGDKETFADFAGAFDHLQGLDAPLDAQGMQEFEDFLKSTYHPPNPYRSLDAPMVGSGWVNSNFDPNTARFTGTIRGPGTGFQTEAFRPNGTTITQFCFGCHRPNTGRGPDRFSNGNENMSADLRTTYRKLGFYYRSSESTAGFGMMSDGIFETLFPPKRDSYLDLYQGFPLIFAGGPNFGQSQDIHSSQDAHPSIGMQETVYGSIGNVSRLNTFITRRNTFDLGLIVKGIYQGEHRGFVYIGNNNYRSDQSGQSVSHNQLVNAAQNGEPLTWMLVHNQVAERLGIDRNSNNIRDKDENIKASFTYSREEPYDIPAVVNFDATTSNNPLSNATSYAWDFGDGSSGTGIAPSHSYSTADTFSVKLTITDDISGKSDVSLQTVIIIPGCISQVGQSCNDPCKPDGIVQPDCSCLGTPVPDNDNDGLCNATDPCPNISSELIGTPCDDGDPCTLNDVWQNSCDCAGIVVDTDEDGICDGIDIDDDNDGITDEEENGIEATISGLVDIGYGSYSVTHDGEISIDLLGGSGGGSSNRGGGLGANVSARFKVSQGDVVHYVIGAGAQAGASTAGGGGSSGLLINHELMMVAGGGAGANNDGPGGLGGNNSSNGRSGTGSDPGAGGQNGQGGGVNGAFNSSAGSGAGIYAEGASGRNGTATSGQAADLDPSDGLTPSAGGEMGTGGSEGGDGFTGGGGSASAAESTTTYGSGGGGGGYSGGGVAGDNGAAGGGGSYINTGSERYISGNITAGPNGSNSGVGQNGSNGSISIKIIKSDFDGDGLINSLDPDSDNDGCPDMTEAGAGLVGESSVTESSSFTSVGANGLADHLETGEDSDQINYSSTYSVYALDESSNTCTDTDGDGVGDIVDKDDDNDGITDLVENGNGETTTIGGLPQTGYGSYTITQTGELSINLLGGSGGGGSTTGGGRGAQISATFSVSAGDIVHYVIGEGSQAGATSAGGGGSSGLFINNELIMVAGGGGGGDNSTGAIGLGGNNLESGLSGTGEVPGTGGQNGQGGTAGSNTNTSGSGAGINSAGANASTGSATGGQPADLDPSNGLSIAAGGSAGTQGSAGGDGFTGGGGAGQYYGAGGGGYSGGGVSGARGSAGGGGSYLNTNSAKYISGSITAGSNGTPSGEAGQNGANGSISMSLTGAPSLSLDFDNDSKINSIDLDSDGDGCPDAFEGSASLVAGDLTTEGRIAGNVDLDPTSSNYGVPILIGSGQGIGVSQDSTAQAPNCPDIEGDLVIRLSMFLEGPYNPNTGLMNDMLRSNGQLGSTDPFGEGATAAPELMVQEGSDACVDWVIVELRDKDNPSFSLATKALLLQRDGDLMMPDGSIDLRFEGLSPDQYHIVIGHKNHLYLASDGTVSLSNGSIIDFQDPNTSVLGGTGSGKIIGNIRVLIAGDANADGTINAVDKNQHWRLENGGNYQYGQTRSDFNGDGTVNAIDKNAYWRINNSKVQQLP